MLLSLYQTNKTAAVVIRNTTPSLLWPALTNTLKSMHLNLHKRCAFMNMQSRVAQPVL